MKTRALLFAALATTSLLSAQDAGARPYGSSPGHTINGPARLYAAQLPVVGTTAQVAFEYNTPDRDPLGLLLSLAPTNFPLFDMNVLVDPTSFVLTVETPSGQTGTGTFTDLFNLPIPNDPTLVGTVYAQVAVLDLTTPGTPQNVLLSEGLELVIGTQEPTQSGEIVITEIMQNPSAVGDNAGEWVEVYNPGPTPIDIEGWLLHDEDFDGVYWCSRATVTRARTAV